MNSRTSSGETLLEQLDREKRTVSYDAYDLSVRQLVDMLETGLIDIAPEYQRHFIWDEERESELIESIYLGIPVPSLYMAANKDGSWEVVDGVQRLSTLIHFCANLNTITKIGKVDPLMLRGLRKLTQLNGKTFFELSQSLQFNFVLRPIRVTTLNDKSDMDVRYDLFERLNTGGVLLHPQEIRNCIYRGKVRDQIKALAKDHNFRSVVLIRESEQTEPIYEECVLRFFAFYDRYKQFEHLVREFLTHYMKEHDQRGVSQALENRFNDTFAFLTRELPRGIVRGRSRTTPLNLYEAVAVGTALVDSPKQGVLENLLNDPQLRTLTQGGTNTNPMVVGRIELVRNALS